MSAEDRPTPEERLRYLAGVTALGLTVAVVGAVLALVVLGRSFAEAAPALGFIGTITATLFLYSGLGGAIQKVQRQVNGNLSREAARADDAVAQLAQIARIAATERPDLVTTVAGRHAARIPERH